MFKASKKVPRSTAQGPCKTNDLIATSHSIVQGKCKIKVEYKVAPIRLAEVPIRPAMI